jgi:hypothetical protein
MKSLKLKGYSGSAHSIGILDDGALYADVHWFDDDRGDSTSTYFVSPASVFKMKQLLTSEGCMVTDDMSLLTFLGKKFSTTSDVVSWLDSQSIPHYKQVDPYANSDVPNTLPEWVSAEIADSEQ